MNNFKESELTVDFRHTLRDIIHAARTWEAHQWVIFNRLFVAVMIACGSVLIYMESYLWGLLFLLFGTLEFFNLLPACAVKALIQYRFDPKYKEKYQLTFSDKHLRFRTTAINSTIKWTHYNKCFETDKAFILVHGKTMYTIIPKRAFTNEYQVNYLRDLFDRVVSKTKINK